MKAKVKQHFTHKDKHYKPGDDFEGTEQEIKDHAQHGHVEPPAKPPAGREEESGKA
jgi:hypothetical protein